MYDFDDIRPFNDDEVAGVLARVIDNPEFVALLSGFVFARWPAAFQPLARVVLKAGLKKRAKKILSVSDFQALVEIYMSRMIEEATDGFTVSGVDNLGDLAHLFLSNHRDIAMDPAFVNFSLYHNNQNTVRIAIGDNLLTKDFVSDLMRLNKSFIVNRSATAPRKMLAAYKKLSAYIHHSIVTDHHHVWMAQREGRAKNSIDKTEPAIIKMLSMSKPKEESAASFLSSLNIIPVSISYEWDPCDFAKANELYHVEKNGSYQKAEHEDVQSIGMGIKGYKGRVHVAFGKPISPVDDPVETALLIDHQIISNYVLMPSNFFAWKELHGSYPDLPCGPDHTAFEESLFKREKKIFVGKMQECPEESRVHWLAIYANPVGQRLALGLGVEKEG